MEIDPELFAFLEACKKLQEEGALPNISTDQLQKMQYEIAEDPDILADLKKLMK